MTKMGVLAAVFVVGGAVQALGAPETLPFSTMTVRPTQAVAQNGLGAGPLQGPLAAPGAGGQAACCPCRTVHHVAHRHVRVSHPRVEVAQSPLVPLVPYRPVYVYQPLVAYRPLVPVYGYRPFFYRPFYRPFFYGRAFY